VLELSSNECESGHPAVGPLRELPLAESWVRKDGGAFPFVVFIAVHFRHVLPSTLRSSICINRRSQRHLQYRAPFVLHNALPYKVDMSNVLHAACDAATATARNEAGQTSHPRFVIATTILASSLAFVDGSVVNVGLSAIGASFRADADDLQWVVNAYLLPLSALLLLGGAVGDRFGRRRLLIAGVSLFGVASLACAAAPSLLWLLVARFVQGVSAAMLMPSSLAILGQSFSGEAKGRAIGIWAAVGAAAGAFGPVLGGWFIDAGSWRFVFLINLPLAAAAIVLAYLYVSVDFDDGSDPLDAIGAALVTAGLGLTTWALTEGSGRGWSLAAFAVLAVGGLFLIAFLLAERRLGDKAMMPLALFGSPSFVGLTLLTFLLYGALGGLFVLVPYVLIEAGGYSATEAGAALLPLPLLIAMASPGAGAFSAKVGPRWPLIIGPVTVAVGFLLVLRIGPNHSYWLGVLPAMVVIALGMGGAVAPLTTAVLMSVDARHVGAASGLNSAVARTGGLVATALIGSVMVARGPSLLTAFGHGSCGRCRALLRGILDRVPAGFAPIVKLRDFFQLRLYTFSRHFSRMTSRMGARVCTSESSVRGRVRGPAPSVSLPGCQTISLSRYVRRLSRSFSSSAGVCLMCTRTPARFRPVRHPGRPKGAGSVAISVQLDDRRSAY
jgi:EmrB/QacA subfamily drug resistance transporter